MPDYPDVPQAGCACCGPAEVLPPNRLEANATMRGMVATAGYAVALTLSGVDERQPRRGSFKKRKETCYEDPEYCVDSGAGGVGGHRMG